MRPILLPVALFASSLIAAPVPAPKQKKPERLPAPKAVKELPCPYLGGWILHWRGGTGPCWITNDGTWQCSWNGSVWEGAWTWKDGKLFVRETEKRGDDDGATLEWDITFERGALEGKLHDGSTAGFSPLVMKPDA